MNRIDSKKEAIAIQMVLRGESTRFIAREVGINKNTAYTLGIRVRESYGAIYCKCGKVAGHKAWCSHRMAQFGVPWRSQLKEITSFNIYIPNRPRYERPDIENERETEIPLLLNRRFIKSFDAPINGYDDEVLHSFIASGCETPLEILMAKEDYMIGEFSDRIKRIEEFKRWQDRQKSAFQF